MIQIPHEWIRSKLWLWDTSILLLFRLQSPKRDTHSHTSSWLFYAPYVTHPNVRIRPSEALCGQIVRLLSSHELHITLIKHWFTSINQQRARISYLERAVLLLPKCKRCEFLWCVINSKLYKSIICCYSTSHVNYSIQWCTHVLCTLPAAGFVHICRRGWVMIEQLHV